MLSPILVAYDGSDLALAGARFALSLGGRPVLVTADDDPTRAAQLLSQGVAALGGGIEARPLVGRPHEVINAEASALDAGLVVVGSRGRSPASGILLGSVARWLLVNLDRPVAVVHREGPVRRVLGALDGGSRDARIVETVRAIAAGTGAASSWVTVVEEDLDLIARPEKYGIPREAWRGRVAAQEARAFAALDAASRANTATRMGIALDSIRDEAGERGADVVVVGRKGAGGTPIDGWFSVAYALAAVGPWTTVVV